MNFTDEKKVEKFNEIVSEYGRLLSYKNNLEITLSRSVEDNLSPDDIKKVHNELVQANTITSFLDSIVYGESKKAQSKINETLIKYDEDNQHNNAEGTDNKENSELSHNA